MESEQGRLQSESYHSNSVKIKIEKMWKPNKLILCNCVLQLCTCKVFANVVGGLSTILRSFCYCTLPITPLKWHDDPIRTMINRPKRLPSILLTWMKSHLQAGRGRRKKEGGACHDQVLPFLPIPRGYILPTLLRLGRRKRINPFRDLGQSHRYEMKLDEWASCTFSPSVVYSTNYCKLSFRGVAVWSQGAPVSELGGLRETRKHINACVLEPYLIWVHEGYRSRVLFI